MAPRGDRYGLSLSEDLGPRRRDPHVERRVEEDRWWNELRHVPKVDTEKKGVVGEIMRMKVKDGDILIMRVPRNYSKMAIEHHIKSIRKALKERNINASVTVVLKEIDILVMSKEGGENVLGVDMKIE